MNDQPMLCSYCARKRCFVGDLSQAPDYCPTLTKTEVIERLVDLVAASLTGVDHAAVLRAVRAREELMSTGVGNSVAIPHGKTNAVTSLVAAFGRCREPVEYEALDGQPVTLVFLLVGPEDAAGPHIKALSRISRLLSYEEFRLRLAVPALPLQGQGVIVGKGGAGPPQGMSLFEIGQGLAVVPAAQADAHRFGVQRIVVVQVVSPLPLDQGLFLPAQAVQGQSVVVMR